MENKKEFKEGECESRCIIYDIKSKYPALNINGTLINMSRQILGLKRGDPRMALHKCNNSRCINKEHLYIGDYKDNSRDAVDVKKFCKNGHDLKANSVVRRRQGRDFSFTSYRRCKLCQKLYKSHSKKVLRVIERN